MRYIRTTNNQIEFIEANDEGKILSSIGLQLGEVYFQLKNHKVSFYLNDSEKPFDNFIWSVNIPLTIDGETYEDEDEVSNVLHNIMNDRFQEQLDQLKEDLAAESARAQEAEEQLDDKIEEETARAINQENRLQDQVTELSGTVATFDSRIRTCEEHVSALTDSLNNEITRSTAKDAEHDAEISGLTNTLNSEIQRALSAETQLHNEIVAETNRAQIAESGITANLNDEIQNRIADVDAEEARALLAESGITNNLNAEISRSTTKDAQHDAEISALTVSLDNEIQRATEAENDLRSDLNDEIADRISGDTNLQNQLDAEIARAQNAEEDLDDKIDAETARANSEETRIEGKLDNEITRSTNKDVEHDTLISGLTDDLDAEIARATARENQIDTKLDNEIARAISAETALHNEILAETNRAEAAEDALDDKIDAEILRSTNKDSEHDSLISGLTSDLATETQNRINADNALQTNLTNEVNRATSAETSLHNEITAEAQRAQNVESGINASLTSEIARSSFEDAKHGNQISGLTTSLNNEITRAQNIEAALRNDLNAEVTARTSADNSLIQRVTAVEVGKADANNVYTKAESDEKFATKEGVSGQCYTKAETDALLNQRAEKALAVATAEYVSANKLLLFKNISGNVISSIDATPFVKDGMLDSVSIVNGNLVFVFNTDAGKQTIQISLTDIFNPNNYYTKVETDDKLAQKLDVSAYTPFSPSEYYTKSETSGKTQIQNALDTKASVADLTNHTSNSTIHVTAQDKTNWNAKVDQSDLDDYMLKSQIWCGTQQQYDAISPKDPNVIYLVH